MAAAARLGKIHHLNPTVMDARTVVRMATLDGAGVIGLGEKIGSLEKGKEADLILIDLDKPHLTPLYNIFSNLVYSASGADVHTVMVGGRMLMRNRSIVAFDLEEVLDQVKRISRKINRSSHGARSG
jgi:5-methylthioadenosine/S-adenosylhomocysteine deaminase